MMLRVDNSTLRAVAACHTQALLRYWWGYEAPVSRPELAAGKAWHAALEAYFKGSSAHDATTIFNTEYRPVGQTVDITDVYKARLAPANLYRIVNQWFAQHPIATFPLKVIAVEQPFCVRLTGDIELVGILDGLGQDSANRWWVLEHKSTGRVTEDWWDQFNLDSQLSTYVYAAREMGHDVIGAYVNAIEFSKLPSDPKRKCPTHGVVYAECGVLHVNSAIRPITRTAEQLAQWKETAITLANVWRMLVTEHGESEAMEHVLMQGQFSQACRWCQFSPYCRMGRPAAYLKANYVVDKWEPLNVRSRKNA